VKRALLAGTGLLAACAAMGQAPNLAEAPGLFFLLFAIAFLCYVAGILWLPVGNGTRSLALVLAIGALSRLLLVAAPPSLSTDAYRYVWDARVAHAGINPYLYAPRAKELEPLRDAEVFPRLNHPTWRTIYPPGAQIFFRAVYRVRPDSVIAMKVALGLAELIGLGAVFGLLKSAGRPLSQAVIYAWNPLVLVEVWGMGHLDALVIPAATAAVWAAVRERYALAGALLGIGALVKLYPAVLLPLLPIAAWPVALTTFSSIVLAGYAPALLGGTVALGSLPRYVSEEYFNPGLLRALVDVPAVSLAATAIWVGAVSAVRRDAPLPGRAVMLIGGLLLLSLNLFPWYAVWIVSFLAVAPSVPWIAFTGTIAFAYGFFLQQPWAIPWWARALEFLPLVIAFLWWLVTRQPALRWQERST
jgi:alpha-1,6-mannosyltransferase